MSASHGPIRLSSYLEIHTTVINRFVAQGFVVEDGLEIDDLGNGSIYISGLIRCAGGVTITVDKYLSIIDPGPPAFVQTVDYSYNASLDGVGNIFRYCSPHPDHNTFHHRHTYDVFSGDQFGNVSESGWPTLGEVIEELRCWTSDHHGNLKW